MSKRKRVLLILLAQIAGIVFPVSHTAFGQSNSFSPLGTAAGLALGGPPGAIAANVIGSTAFSFVFQELGNLVIKMLAFLMGALAWMVDFVAQFLVAIIHVSNFQNVAIVNLGWHVTLDFVNLLFILILLVIGFATIFRMETYGIKALLPRLIIVALLINFSKVIAGVVIDVGNLLAQFFLTPMEGSLGTALMNLLNLQKTFATQWDLVGGISRTSNELLKATPAIIFGQFLGVLAMAVVVVGLFLYSMVFVVRIVVLWLLVIVAPFAWIASILPGTRSYFSMWWNNFIKWVMIAPVMVFFLFLLAAMGKEAGDSGLIGFVYEQNLGQIKQVTSFADDPRFLLQYAIVMGFILAGPIAANQMGAMGAAGVIGIASAGQRWVLNQTGRGALGAAGGAARYGAERAGERLAPKVQQWSDRLAASKYGKWLGPLTRAGIRMGEGKRANIQEAMKKYQHLSTGALVSTRQTMSGINETDRMAITTVLAQRRDLNDQTAEKQAYARKEMADVINIGHARGEYETIKPILAMRPNLAKDEEEKKKAVREAIRTGAHKNWGDDAMADGETIRILHKELGATSQAITNFGKQLGKVEQDAFLKGLKKAFNTGNFEQDFNTINSDLREAYAAISPENYLDAITGSVVNSETGTAINNAFAKSVAYAMSGPELERFYADAAPDQYTEFEKARGVIRATELERAARKSGKYESYTKNLKGRLDGISTVKDYYDEDNMKRASLYALLTGEVGVFAPSEALKQQHLATFKVDAERLEEEKRLRRQRNAELSNFITPLNPEDAEEFGRKVNDDEKKGIVREEARTAIAEFATSSQLPNFMRGLKRKYREEVLRTTKKLHPEKDKKGEKIQENINFMNTLRKHPYITAIAVTSDPAIDLGKMKKVYDSGTDDLGEPDEESEEMEQSEGKKKKGGGDAGGGGTSSTPPKTEPPKP